MLGRFGRRRPEASLEELTRERSEAALSTTALVSLLQAIEASATRVYSRHGLPQQPGHYRRPAAGGAWEQLGGQLSPAEKWALINSPDGTRWRYAAHEALGATSDVAVVRQASAILAACLGLRQRLAEQTLISHQDLADAIRLGDAWRRLDEDNDAPSPATPPHRLPPDDAQD